MSKTTSFLALALFLSMAPAIAQTTQTPPPPQSTEATQSQSTTTDQAQQPALSTQSEPAKAPETATTTEAQAPAPSTDATKAPEPEAQSAAKESKEKPITGQIMLQDENTMLASSMIGATVYSPNEEQIGDINDIIVKSDGTVQGVVVGVGGFLGMGEKNVAVEMKQLTLTPRDDGSVRLVLNASKEELENAPAFKTAAELASEKSAMEDQQRAQNQLPNQTTIPQQPSTNTQ